jgi:DNA gyrase/topoisomerase IV subunit A
MSDIDLLVNLIRNSDNRAAAKTAIMKAFELNDEQADAVLDMKLSKLSRLDLTELNDEETNLRETLAKLRETMDNEGVRYNIIRSELKEIKGVLGKDERITEVQYKRPVEGLATDEPLIKKEWQIYRDGLHGSVDGTTVVANNLVDVVFAYTPEDIYVYSADGELGLINELAGKIEGAVVKGSQKKVVAVTASGNVKVSSIDEYKFKKSEKVMKLKDGDSIKFVGLCDDDDYLMLFDGTHILKLAIKDLPLASKMTLGVKSGFTTITAAAVVKDSSLLLFSTSDNKGKFTAVKDFSVDSRGNKGQLVPENTRYMRFFDENRETIYIIPKQGNTVSLARNKLSVKGRTAIGASMTTRVVIGII